MTKTIPFLTLMAGMLRAQLTWVVLLLLMPLVSPIQAADTEGSTVEMRHVRTLKNEFVITELAWHPDGRHLAVGQVLNKRVAIWDTQEGKLVRVIESEGGGVQSVAYSPDGKYVAVGRSATRLTSDHAHVHLYDANSGALLHRFVPPGPSPDDMNDALALVFSPGGKYLAAVGYGSTSTGVVYEIASKKVIQDLPNSEGRWAAINVLRFSPDNSLLVVGRTGGGVDIWSTKTWKFLKHLEGQSGGVYALAFSPDGKYLATGTHIGKRYDLNTKPPRPMFDKFPDDIVLWSIPAFKKTDQFPSRHFTHTPYSSIIERLQFSPDGKLLLVSARTGSLEIIDVISGKTALFKGGFKTVVEAALRPDGKSLAIGLGNKIEIYQLITL